MIDRFIQKEPLINPELKTLYNLKIQVASLDAELKEAFDPHWDFIEVSLKVGGDQFRKKLEKILAKALSIINNNDD